MPYFLKLGVNMNIVFYSTDEVLQDFISFEGIEINISSMVLNNFQFINLYSECYKQPTNDEATVDDLKEKLIRFIEKHAIPIDIDEKPKSDFNFYLYDLFEHDDENIKAKFLIKSDSLDEAMDKINEFVTSNKIIVVDTKNLVLSVYELSDSSLN